MKPEERKAFAARLEEQKRQLATKCRLDPSVIITLKKADYTLEFNNYSVKGILKDTGLNLIKDGLAAGDLDDPDAVGSVLFWGLTEHHEDLDQDKVDKMCDYRHLPYILSKLREALSLFMPDMTGWEPVVAEESPEAPTTKDPT